MKRKKSAKKVKAAKKPKTRTAPEKRKKRGKRTVKAGKTKKKSKPQSKPRAPRVEAKGCKQRDNKGYFLPGNTVGVNVPHNQSLTEEIAKALEEHWKLSGPNTISDQEICDRIGITLDKLNGWLKRDTKVDIVRVIGVNKKTGEDITKIERIGLRQLRIRARAQLKIGYLARMNRLVDSAEAASRHSAAVKAQAWLLEHQFPKDFGSRAAEPPTDKPKLIRMPLRPPSTKKKKNNKKQLP